MSDEERQKADELKRLLERVQTADSFESASLAERIATLAREVLAKDQAKGQQIAAH